MTDMVKYCGHNEAARRRKHKKSTTGMAIMLAAALLLTVKLPVLAVESDRDNRIRSVRVSDSQIAACTLVIGSYLIDLKGLSDHIYEIVMDSAGEFSQNRMYYKSELSGGQWFEITDATSIRDITTAGTPVAASVIEELAFTHQVTANGTVTDLRVHAAVNAFDIPDPYDLPEMEELLPIKMHWQYLQSKETRTESDEKYLEILEIFYGLSIEDDVTRDCDASLDALNPYQLGVIAREKPGSWTEAVNTVMEGEDARRRVQSLNTLDSYLDELLKKAGGQDQEGLSPQEMEAFYEMVQKSSGGEVNRDDIDDLLNDKPVGDNDNNVSNGDSTDSSAEKDASWYERWHSMRESYQKLLAEAGTYRGVTLDETFQVDANMISAIGEAKSNVKTSIGKYTGKLLAEGTAASAQAIYRYSKEMIGCARAKDTPGCDKATAGLADLYNILKSVIENEESERKTLEDGLTGQALSVWQGILSGGAGKDYRQAEGEGAGQPALTAFLSQRETEADSARLEYQAMLTELWKRMSNSAAQIDAEGRINAIARLEALPPADAAQKHLLGTVEKHREWLKKSLAGLIAASADSSALDQLLKAQNDLESQRLNALDENDLAKAKRLSAEMEAGQGDIDDLRQELYHTLTDPVSSAADKARAAAGMTEKSAGKLIDELAGNITSGILDGADGSTLDRDMAALSQLAQYDSDAALAAVSGIRDTLKGAANTEAESAVQIGAQLADIEREAEKGAGTGGVGGMLSQEQLTNLLADYFGDAATASDQDKAGALIALSRYAQDSHNQSAAMLAVLLANQSAAKGSPYLYQKYDRAADVYISLQAIGRIFGYRYLFDDVHHMVTLQKAEDYYIFTSGDVIYEFTEGAEGRLTVRPVLQATLYLDSDDAKRIFDGKGYYVPGCSYAAVETAAMEPVIEEVYNGLMNAK